MFTREPSIIAYVLAAVDLVVSLVATGHVLLFKRDTRAAIGWIGLIWLSPILGAILYLLLGINRIERKARKLLRGRAHSRQRRNVRTTGESSNRQSESAQLTSRR